MAIPIPLPSPQSTFAIADRCSTTRDKGAPLARQLFDDPEALRSNQATVEYVESVAAAEGLDKAGAVDSLNGGNQPQDQPPGGVDGR